MQLIQQAEQRKQQLMQENHQKQMAESEAKNQKRIEARKAIEEWKAQRQNQIALKRQNNVQVEQMAKAEVEAARQGSNPWERINNNCDFSTNASGKDKTRMKQAMMARKGDKFDASGKSTSNSNANFF